MAYESTRAAKKALAEWFGHRDHCWTCASLDGGRCDAGQQLHDHFMTEVRASRTEYEAGQLAGRAAEYATLADDTAPLW